MRSYSLETSFGYNFLALAHAHYLFHTWIIRTLLDQTKDLVEQVSGKMVYKFSKVHPIQHLFPHRTKPYAFRKAAAPIHIRPT